MMESILDTFILSGNTVLSCDGSLFGFTSLGYSGSIVYNYFQKDPVGAVISLISISASSATLSGCSSDIESRNVQDTYMVFESMNLEELQELRGLVDEKGNNLKLHM